MDKQDKGGPAANRPPPTPLLDKAEQGKTYRGRVSGVMDFGAFVELLGFRGKAEGLVHVTNIARNRCAAESCP